MYNPYSDSIKILASKEYGTPSFYIESSHIATVLEDANSPITRKYQEKMYKAIINKAHIDFGDIPNSKGIIKNYSGYNTMVDTLNTMKKLAMEDNAKNVINYADIVLKAITNISELSATYQKGFNTKTYYVALEYNTYVYFCVEATTALIYSFVDIMKVPDKKLLSLKIKNTDMRADAFYFEQLAKFNTIQDKMGINYRKMMEAMCNDQRSNFIGLAEIVGVGAVVSAAMAIIPLTREVIYQVYNVRGKLSNYLETQALFLELNKSTVENNSLMTVDEKKKVLKKQESIYKQLRKYADKLRVSSATSISNSKRELDKENKSLSLDSLQDDVSNSPFELV